MTDIENVVIYVSDGVRWDFHPEEIRKRGLTFETIASSLHTPTAIASLLTGRYLPSHGIRGFTDRLGSSQQTVLDWQDNVGLSDTAGNFNDIIYKNLLGRYEPVSLEEIETPFTWFMRDAGGHAPYDEFDESLQTNETVRSFLKRHAGDNETLRETYKNGIDSSVDRFDKFVVEPLEERGLLESTVIVFISDHGQLLGEHGHQGESYPACPELVYVPTTLIHPSLEVSESETLMRHVDLAPTLYSLLDTDLPSHNAHGLDVLSPDVDPEIGLNFYNRLYPSILGEFDYEVNSVWDRNGGHAFVDSNLWNRAKLLAGFLAKIPAGIQLRRSKSLFGVKSLLESQRTWETPGFSESEARQYLSEFDEQTDGDDLEMADNTRENLEDLGYL